MKVELELNESGNLKLVMLESCINMMEEARLGGDTKMLKTCARLVHEGWHDIFLIGDEPEESTK